MLNLETIEIEMVWIWHEKDYEFWWRTL